MKDIQKVVLIIHPGYEHLSVMLGRRNMAREMGWLQPRLFREEKFERKDRFDAYKEIVDAAAKEQGTLVVLDTFTDARFRSLLVASGQEGITKKTMVALLDGQHRFEKYCQKRLGKRLVTTDLSEKGFKREIPALLKERGFSLSPELVVEPKGELAHVSVPGNTASFVDWLKRRGIRVDVRHTGGTFGGDRKPNDFTMIRRSKKKGVTQKGPRKPFGRK